MAAHLFLLEISPFALILDHVTLKHFWVRHVEGGGRELRFELIESIDCIERGIV